MCVIGRRWQAKHELMRRIQLLQDEAQTSKVTSQKFIEENKNFTSQNRKVAGSFNSLQPGTCRRGYWLKKQMEDKAVEALTLSTKLDPKEIFEMIQGTSLYYDMLNDFGQEGFELFCRGALRQPLDPTTKIIIEDLNYDILGDEEDQIDID